MNDFTVQERDVLSLFEKGSPKAQRLLSNISKIVAGVPEFIQIQQMGTVTIRPLLHLLQRDTHANDWEIIYMLFTVLENQAPNIPEDKSGRLREIKDILIQFGKDRNYIS